MSCPHCGSADVRPSRRSLGLDRIGLHRYRCRACGGLFWLRGSRVEAVQARRRDYLEPLPGMRLPRRRAKAPAALLRGLDRPPDAAAPAIDLQALDLELARQRDDLRRR
jgi:hypothetical protein